MDTGSWNGRYSLAIALIMAVGACTGEGAADRSASSAVEADLLGGASTALGQVASTGDSPAQSAATAPTATPITQCPTDGARTGQSGIPESLRGLQTTAESITVGDFTVDFAAHPLPYPEGNPWSHWGKGRLASNGKFYTAVGDHGSGGSCGRIDSDGNSLLYEYDPTTRVLRAVGDALSAAGEHRPGENGYGKIHSQIDEGPCGMLYLHTYWGSSRCVTYTDTYRGDLLLRYDPRTEDLQSVGVVMPGHGTPSTNMWEAGGLLYGEANVSEDGKDTKFWVWDTETQTLKYRETAGVDRRNRNIAVDLRGRAYINDGRNGLRRYDPETNEIEQLDLRFDHGGTDEFLRASTERVEDGTLTLVTENNTDASGNRQRRYSEFYHFDPEHGSLTWLAHDDRYVGDIEADPTGRVAYYTPGAHESANDFSVVELNRTTGEKRVLVSLGEAIRDAGGPHPGGSFSVSISPDGRTLFFASNSTLERPGLPMIVVVHIPPSEMP